MSTIKVDSVVNKSGDSDSGINLGTNDTVKFDIAGSTKWTLNSSGNLFPSSTSQGICFGVTSDTASNRLEDYEEGTWTPVVSSGITSPTYSSQNGKYTKIGNLVRAYATCNTNGGTGNSSGFIIGGLPFTTKNDSTYTTATMYVNLASGNGKDTRLITYPNTTTVYLYAQTETGVEQYTGQSVANGTNVQLYFTLIYEADGG
jgi:hypothetical protein